MFQKKDQFLFFRNTEDTPFYLGIEGIHHAILISHF